MRKLNFEILQLRTKFQFAMVPCSRFILITNSNDHMRVWTANLLNTKWLSNPLAALTLYARDSQFKPSCGHHNKSENKLSQEEKVAKDTRFLIQFPSCKFSFFKVFKINKTIFKWSPMSWLLPHLVANFITDQLFAPNIYVL